MSEDSRDDRPDAGARTEESSSRAPASLTCFVIGPIGTKQAPIGSPERETYEESLRVMEEVINPACSAVGLSPVRADQLTRAGEINEQIFRRLRDDDVVIADLTGANPNVMYELGLRHTRAKLTVQIGEFSRLPFDVNMIRTIQFSRSPIGLINARQDLVAVLTAGIAGEFDSVTATRVWAKTAEAEVRDDGWQESPPVVGEQDAQGFLDVLAAAEDKQELLASAMETIHNITIELGELADASTQEIERSDAAGKGMRGRLQVATKHASALDDISGRLDAAVEHYVEALDAVGQGADVLIAEMERDPGSLAEGRQFGMIVRQTAHSQRDAVDSLAGLTSAISTNARLSQVLREPSRKIVGAFDRYAQANMRMDDWDRRLQSLGIEKPDPDWEPDLGDDDQDVPRS